MRFISFLVAFLTALAPAAYAQALPRSVVEQNSRNVDQLFNWYYASVYGTGFYKIDASTVYEQPIGDSVRSALCGRLSWERS